MLAIQSEIISVCNHCGQVVLQETSHHAAHALFHQEKYHRAEQGERLQGPMPVSATREGEQRFV